MNFSTVLYVEDEPDIRQIVKLILDQAGVKVHEFENGTEAIDAADKLEPDLIILDLMLKGMDGDLALTKLREFEHLSTVPCIFLTAKVDASTLGRIQRIDNVEIMRKPFKAEQLTSTLNRLFKKMTA